jgi:hypothetical protein
MSVLDQILISVISASATAILAYFGFWRQAKAQLMKEYLSRFNEKKWDIYIRYIKLVSTIRELQRLVESERGREEKHTAFSEADALKLESLTKDYDENFYRLENEILLIGSTNVVETFFKWRAEIIADKGAADEKMVAIQIRLLNYMREDLGTGKSNLNVSALDGSYFPHKKLLDKILEKYETASTVVKSIQVSIK